MKIKISIEIDKKNSLETRAVKEVIEAVGKMLNIATEEVSGQEDRPDEGLPYKTKPIIPENFHGLHEALR